VCQEVASHSRAYFKPQRQYRHTYRNAALKEKRGTKRRRGRFRQSRNISNVRFHHKRAHERETQISTTNRQCLGGKTACRRSLRSLEKSEKKNETGGQGLSVSRSLLRKTKKPRAKKTAAGWVYLKQEGGGEKQGRLMGKRDEGGGQFLFSN